MKTSYILVEQTTYPYFFYGLSLIVLAVMLAVLPYLPILARKTAKNFSEIALNHKGVRIGVLGVIKFRLLHGLP